MPRLLETILPYNIPSILQGIRQENTRYLFLCLCQVWLSNIFLYEMLYNMLLYKLSIYNFLMLIQHIQLFTIIISISGMYPIVHRNSCNHYTKSAAFDAFYQATLQFEVILQCFQLTIHQSTMLAYPTSRQHYLVDTV